MTTITAKIIADSIGGKAPRLVTAELRYPRFVHAEFMTHRVFGRNASSSRAIPVKKMIRDVRADPAMPIHWGANEKGMQASRQLTGWRLWGAKKLWLGGMYLMTTIAGIADKLGAHKQIVNRLIEPWAHITVTVTSTKWANFFALRRHKDAQPEIRILADALYEAMQVSKPRILQPGEWHTPYIKPDDRAATSHIVSSHEVTELLLKVSVARCARTSYLTHDGRKSTFDEDIKLHDRLVVSQPLHASPAEHQARFRMDYETADLGGNLGPEWVQYRQILPGQVVLD